MNSVIGVGAPSQTSGIHMVRTAPSLNAIPDTRNKVEHEDQPVGAGIDRRRNAVQAEELVAPYTIDMP